MYLILLQWEKKVEKGQEDFEEISKTIQKEFTRFEVRGAESNFACHLPFLCSQFSIANQITKMHDHMVKPTSLV